MTTKTTDPKTDVSKRAEKRRRPMLRFAFWTFIGTAGVLTAAAGGAAWLVGTESGRSAALNLAVRFVPGFEAQAISGPWDDLTLKGIGWMSPGISAKIDELHLGWDWRALFQHSLHVTKLEVVGADIKVDTTALPASEDAPADDAAGLPDLQLPFAVILEQAALLQIRTEIDDLRLTVGQFAASAELIHGELRLPEAAYNDLMIEAPAFSLSSNAFKATEFQFGGNAATVNAIHLTGGRVSLAKGSEEPLAAEAEAVKADELSTASDGLAQANASSAAALQGFAQALDEMLQKPFVTKLPAVAVPLDAKLTSLVVTDWQIAGLTADQALPGLAPLVLNKAEIKNASVQKDGSLSVEAAAIDSSVLSISASAEAKLADAWPLSVHLEARADAEPWGKLLGIRFKSPQSTLVMDLSGEVIGELKLAGSAAGALDLAFSLSADPSKPYLPFNASLTSSELLIPALAVKQTAQSAAEAKGAVPPDAASAAQTQKDKIAQLQEAGAAQASADASEALKNAFWTIRDLAFHAGGDARKYSFTLSGKPEVSASQAILAGKKTFAGVIDAALSGTLSGARIDRFVAETPLGRLEAAGSAEWPKDLDWSGTLKADNIDLGGWVVSFPLKLVAEASGTGSLTTAGNFAFSAKSQVKGAIGKQNTPLELRLAAAGENGLNWRMDDFYVLLGRNTASAAGSIEELRGVKLDMKLDAPGLLNTIPGLSGRAKGNVHVDGSLANPVILADLKAEKLAYNDIFALEQFGLYADLRNSPNPDADVERLKLKAFTAYKRPVQKSSPSVSAAPAEASAAVKTADTSAISSRMPPGRLVPPKAGSSAAEKFDFIVRSLSEGEVVGKLLLNLKELTAPGVNMPQLEVSLQGRETAHALKLMLDGEPVSGSVALTGGFSRDTLDWTGRLTRASLTTPAGVWSNASPADMTWSTAKTQATIAGHCWKHDDAEVCAPKTLVLGRSGEAELRLTRLSMSVLKPYLRRKSDTLEGALTGGVRLKWDLDNGRMPEGMADLNGDGLAYSTRWQGVRIPVELERLRAHALLSEKRVALAWDVKPKGNGSIWGEVGVIDPMKTRRLEGRFGLTGVTPSFIQPFLSKGEKAEGVVNADLRAGGTLIKPELYGSAALEDVVVNADLVPFDMEPSGLELRFNGRSSTLTGEVRSLANLTGKTNSSDRTLQKIELSGSASWESLTDWHASARVKTDGLRLTLPPSIRLDVKADVKTEADPKSASASGSVEIPSALIEINELPASAVAVSDDQVMLDANLNPIAAKTESLPIRADVDIVIGEKDVRVKAYGLDASLSGKLKFMMGGGRMGLLGSMNIPRGRFRAYGQDLLIQTGEFLFSGPMANPSIRLEAIRNPESTEDDVTAGIRVTGTADEPVVQLFSTPSMSDEEALSYLLRGEGLGSEDGSSSAMMTSMLIGLGTSQGGGILSEIGDAVGLSGVGIDTAGSGESQQVVVSAYLLPGLQVKYGVGIFDSLATLTLRYRLMPRLYLEAVSGVNQALDLLYRFEF
ncbi:translocation/assembly module TamB domain-containing protein [Sutterella wadsworthensis]|uniref:translocation/assembly module TamB domain-containing protein n=1 Tax=Sutterella wadsworthensis TaxID=40545 RepID=UPI00242A5572|nr:translocation/assembly module TamB [Sutterella wadsworthensis]